MASPFSIPAIGGISDPEEVRVVLFVNGQFVHVPLKQLLKELDADNLASGTVPDDRISNTLTADKAYRRGNILGTVSQSGGVPAGALIEHGSNANGDYVRFADGTQICFSPVINSITAVASGSIFTDTVVPQWTFPAAFSSKPTWYGHSVRVSGSGVGWLSNLNYTPTTTSMRFRLASSFNSHEADCTITAIGRWF